MVPPIGSILSRGMLKNPNGIATSWAWIPKWSSTRKKLWIYRHERNIVLNNSDHVYQSYWWTSCSFSSEKPARSDTISIENLCATTTAYTNYAIVSTTFSTTTASKTATTTSTTVCNADVYFIFGTIERGLYSGVMSPK